MLTYLLIIITLYLAGNAYIFIRAKQALKVKSLGVKIFLTVLFWICALSFFGTMLARNLEMPVFISHSMYIHWNKLVDIYSIHGIILAFV